MSTQLKFNVTLYFLNVISSITDINRLSLEEKLVSKLFFWKMALPFISNKNAECEIKKLQKFCRSWKKKFIKQFKKNYRLHVLAFKACCAMIQVVQILINFAPDVAIVINIINSFLNNKKTLPKLLQATLSYIITQTEIQYSQSS